MVAQVFHANLADLDTTAQVALGAIYELDNARYKYVKFSGTTTIAVGDVLCYVAAASDGAQQIVDKANTGFGAGVAVVAVPSGTVMFGWIQITGLVAVSGTPAGSPALGDSLTTAGATAGNVTKAVAGNGVVGNYYGVVNTKSMIAAEFDN